jgi:long-subunit fatty acid transport protein
MAAPAPQAAQPTEDQQSSGQTNRLPVIVSSGLSEQFNSSIDKGGDFSITRFKVGVGVPVKLRDDLQLGTTFRYEYDHFNFDNTFAPWENINTFSLASILQWQMDDALTIYGGGFVKMSAESGSSLGDGITGGGLAGFSYKVNEDLSLGLGLAVASQLEEDARVLPLITARWKFADNWRLDAGLTDVTTIGYGVELKYLLDKEFDFGLGVQFHKSRFKIDAGDGYGQEEATTIYADATWHASPHVDLGGFIGLATGGKLRVDNSSGTKIAQSDYDPAAILGVKATLRF